MFGNSKKDDSWVKWSQGPAICIHKCCLVLPSIFILGSLKKGTLTTLKISFIEFFLAEKNVKRLIWPWLTSLKLSHHFGAINKYISSKLFLDNHANIDFLF